MERKHALLSPSSAHRWLVCPPSALVSDFYPEQDTAFTREGTAAHAVAERVARVRVLEDGGAGPELPEESDGEMLECAQEYALFIREHCGANTRVFLEERVDISPWVPDCFGTCDCILLDPEKLTIIDYKYGQGVPVSAEKNPQMMLYALGAYNDFGIACDLKTVEMFIFQPRLNSVSGYALPLPQLLAWGEKTVKPAATKAAEGKGRYRAGDHCRFCPHAGKCRALNKACRQIVTTHGGQEMRLESMAPAEVAEVLDLEPLITLWLRRVKERALADLMSGEHIPGYKLVEGKQGNRKWTDEGAVCRALEDAGYSPAVYTETKLLSPSGLDKAIGRKAAAELLSGFIDRAPGAPVIAPETDRRQPLDRLADAQKDFA